MANVFRFTRFAEKKFVRLEKDLRRRIQAKLSELKEHDHLEAILKLMIDFDGATHRLRIGEYRLILQKISDQEFLIVDIGHRRNVYK